MAWLTELFAKYPELAVYLAIGVGYVIGNVRLGNFSFGGTTGSLLAGIGIGLLFPVQIASQAKSLVFLLFLFGIGYSVGPRFLSAMRGDGWRYAVVGVVMPIVGLLAAWGVATFLELDVGFASGLLSGALTESPAMGTASEAIMSLPLPDDEKHRLVGHIGVADALCYIFGALGVVVFCGQLGPKLLGIDLRAQAARVEARFGIKRDKAGVVSAWQPFDYRAYRVPPGGRAVGLPIADAERMGGELRMFVLRLRRGGEILPVRPALVIEPGDVVVVAGRHGAHVELLGDRVEVEDRELLDIPIASCEVFVSRRDVAGTTLAELAKRDEVRAVFLKRIVRGEVDIPIGQETRIERGDVLHVTGPEESVKRAAGILGEVVTPSDATDFGVVGIAIFLGAAFGATAAIAIGGQKVALGTSVGTLIAGIVTGYVRSRRPLFGRVPDAAISFMQSLGLAGFVCMVGIAAGPHFVQAVREAGVGLLLGGVVVTMVPLFAGLYFGRYVLKIDPLLLLGAIAGAQTFTPGLAAVQERSGSPIAVLGYSGSVAVGHVLLTTCGTAIVLFVAR